MSKVSSIWLAFGAKTCQGWRLTEDFNDSDVARLEIVESAFIIPGSPADDLKVREATLLRAMVHSIRLAAHLIENASKNARA